MVVLMVCPENSGMHCFDAAFKARDNSFKSLEENNRQAKYKSQRLQGGGRGERDGALKLDMEVRAEKDIEGKGEVTVFELELSKARCQCSCLIYRVGTGSSACHSAHI